MSAEVYAQQCLEAAASGTWPAWLQARRAAAARRFAEQGFPTLRQEEWKYTNLAPIERKRFAPPSAASASDGGVLRDWLLPDAYHLVFVDGRFHAAMSVLPHGGSAASLAALPDRAEGFFGLGAAREDHGFIHFNTACFTDGALVHLPAGAKLDRPLQLLCAGTVPDSLSVLRNLIVLEAGAEATLVETFVGADGNAYLSAAVNEILLETGAKLTVYKLQSEADRSYHFGGTYAQVGMGARFEHHSFAFGGLLARSEAHVALAERGECELNGLFLGARQQHLDNHVRVDHQAPGGFSRETYKGILDGRARGVFQGRVVVKEGAQQTDAAMNNRNLLLSPDAEVDTKPQLEIYADDVKCSHGVTVGQLNAESVFYLESRGLDEAEARNVLTFAFANEMVDRVALPDLRMQIRDRLLAQLPQTAIEKAWL